MVRSRLTSLALALALSASRMGRAQPAPLTPPALQAAQPTAHPAEPSAVDAENARRLFREGVEYFQQSNFRMARDRFLRANRIRPSPLVRFNLGLACHNAGYFIESIDAYRRFLAEAPQTPEWQPRRQAAEREIASLELRRARMRITVTGDEVREFRLDGVTLSPANLGTEMPVDPGSHHIDVEGAGGGHQEADGVLVESQSLDVNIALSPRASVQSARVEAGWQSHSQTFGRPGIARPGPGGLFIDWSQREPAALSATWDRHPFTVGLQLATHSATGMVGLSARYFPQPWFGLELTGGALSSQKGMGAGLLAHLRIPLAAPSRWALGLFSGPLASDLGLDLVCTVQDNCSDQAPTRAEHVLGLWVSAGASVEWRFATHWSLRALAGIQQLVNAASVRGVADHGSYACRSNGGSGVNVCDVFDGTTSPSLTQGFAAIDLGFSP